MITSFLPQEPPRLVMPGLSAHNWNGGPPVAVTFINLPETAYPMERPSGDQNGRIPSLAMRVRPPRSSSMIRYGKDNGSSIAVPVSGFTLDATYPVTNVPSPTYTGTVDPQTRAATQDVIITIRPPGQAP